ncbi:hypothetical protein CTI12_AA211720 [Artemisia annua]|uniref:BED-type domain-containing protein n=1 Tax=Artemisia annua TaxID=35608 RepID=A0A2U1MLU4_ARTAN|nr:hypothetical protein CTI12_AA211720 [Artemisia annua]
MEGQSSHASVNPNVSSSANTSSDAGTGLKSASGDIAWEWGLLKDPTKRGMVWCTLCDKRMSGGITRLKQHLTHTKGDVTGCTKSVGTSNVRGPLDSILKSDHQKTSQSTLDKNNPTKQKLKMVAWKKIATWAYSVGLPFNAVRDESFQDMINAIGDYGRCMPAPSYHNLRVTLLKDALEDTNKFVCGHLSDLPRIRDEGCCSPCLGRTTTCYCQPALDRDVQLWGLAPDLEGRCLCWSSCSDLSRNHSRLPDE